MDSGGVSQIVAALGVVYEPKSSNAQRREAQDFLESIKSNDELPYWGYQLALPENNGKNYIVRHFGLSLLQNSIKSKYHLFDTTKTLAIRNWVVDLSNKIQQDDPHYLKEKIAFLWVSIAKRIWGCYLIKGYNKDNIENSHPPENHNHNDNHNSNSNNSNSDLKPQVSEQEASDGWASMDADLWKLWSLGFTCRELSLIIIRTLFEDIYLLDDPIASKRTIILNQLSVLIVTPSSILDAIYEHNPNVSICKALPNGWFVVWSQFLIEILSSNDFKSSTCQASFCSQNSCYVQDVFALGPASGFAVRKHYANTHKHLNNP